MSTDTIPYTPRVKGTLAIAHKIARTKCHGYVGMEHLLVALLSYKEGAAFELLEKSGFSTEDLRIRVNFEFDKAFPPATCKPDAQVREEVAALLSQAAEMLRKG